MIAWITSARPWNDLDLAGTRHLVLQEFHLHPLSVWHITTTSWTSRPWAMARPSIKVKLDCPVGTFCDCPVSDRRGIAITCHYGQQSSHRPILLKSWLRSTAASCGNHLAMEQAFGQAFKCYPKQGWTSETKRPISWREEAYLHACCR